MVETTYGRNNSWSKWHGVRIVIRVNFNRSYAGELIFLNSYKHIDRDTQFSCVGKFYTEFKDGVEFAHQLGRFYTDFRDSGQILHRVSGRYTIWIFPDY